MTHYYCRRYAATAIIIINRMSAMGVVFVINSQVSKNSLIYKIEKLSVKFPF